MPILPTASGASLSPRRRNFMFAFRFIHVHVHSVREDRCTYVSLAQWIEQRIFNPWAIGSIPIRNTSNYHVIYLFLI